MLRNRLRRIHLVVISIVATYGEFTFFIFKYSLTTSQELQDYLLMINPNRKVLGYLRLGSKINDQRPRDP